MIRLLAPADIPVAMRLKEAAGWNQSEQDWANLLALEPEGCFGIDCDGVLVATSAAVCYGERLAWIGMVLTAPEYRGRGLARRLMERTLEFLEARRVAWIKLDATDMGRPLYIKLGFEEEGCVERCCLPRVEHSRPVDLPPARLEDFLELDRAAFGADRGAVLRRVACESAAIPGEGYAVGRPGSQAAYFGPCVCRSAETARTLLQWFLARHPGESVFWDLPPGNAAALSLARELGFSPRRRLTRMWRCGVPGAAPFHCNDTVVFAIAGFEYG